MIGMVLIVLSSVSISLANSVDDPSPNEVGEGDQPNNIEIHVMGNVFGSFEHKPMYDKKIPLLIPVLFAFVTPMFFAAYNLVMKHMTT